MRIGNLPAWSVPRCSRSGCWRSAPPSRSPLPTATTAGKALWGETNDKVVTNAGFILIAGFPLLVWILSIAYNRLEDRRLRRLAACEGAHRAR